MGGLFSKPKSVKMPPVEEPEPLAVPETGDEEAKRTRRRKGKGKTIVTGELEPEFVGKQRLLG